MTDTAQKRDFPDVKRALQGFQSARLNTTYADLKSDPQYEKIGVFFFEKLYAPEDFSFRDASIKKLQKILKGKVYRGMVSAVGQVIELHELSDRLDDRMVADMLAAGIGPDMDMDQYQEIYRGLDNYDERVYQINLSTEVTRAFHRLSRKWIVALSLKTVRTTAHMIGMGKIIDFIYEGYEGFRAIKSIDFFVDTVQERELAWHNEICNGGQP
ncbi:MAG: hypothetical protein GY697_17740 [Desulfobacterales bacterium]|nr:hypothetical protein [Desulfobacterales bacterium]